MPESFSARIARVARNMDRRARKRAADETAWGDVLHFLRKHEAYDLMRIVQEGIDGIAALEAAHPPVQPTVTPTEADDDEVIRLAQELVRVGCERICDDVAQMSEWDGDPNDTEKRYKAGVMNTCEEIKTRIGMLNLKGTVEDLIASAASPLQPTMTTRNDQS